MRSRLGTRQFKSIVVGADTLVPLSAPGRDGTARWRLHGGAPVKYLAYSAQSGLGQIVATRWEAKDRAFTLETVFTSHLAATLLLMTRAGDGVAWLPGPWPKKTSRPGCWSKQAIRTWRYLSKFGFFLPSHVRVIRRSRYGPRLSGADVPPRPLCANVRDGEHPAIYPGHSV